MSSKLNLYQFLKRSGLFDSRTALVKAVSRGRVTVDGEVTKTIQFQFNPNQKRVEIDGMLVTLQPLRYFVLNKAQDYSCQRNDRKRYVLDVMDIDRELKNSLFPIGRLDVPTRGLLLVTNDGAFSNKVLSPKHKVVKTYVALTKLTLTDEMLEELSEGVVIDIDQQKDYKTLPPEKVEMISDHKLLLSITEGKYRQVRKMVEAVRNRVMDLQRISIGGLKLEELKIPEGDWKELGEEEIKRLVLECK